MGHVAQSRLGIHVLGSWGERVGMSKPAPMRERTLNGSADDASLRERGAWTVGFDFGDRLACGARGQARAAAGLR
jgi:hypothetical protein